MLNQFIALFMTAYAISFWVIGLGVLAYIILRALLKSSKTRDVIKRFFYLN